MLTFQNDYTVELQHLKNQ